MPDKPRVKNYCIRYTLYKIYIKCFVVQYFIPKGRLPLQSFCPRGRSEHVSTFAIGANLSVFCLLEI